MTGESHRDDDPDIHDDDFILEDAADNELEDLFKVPGKPGQPKAQGPQDESDVLFQDQNVKDVSEHFAGRQGFAEGEGPWAGESLSPDEIGIPVENTKETEGEETLGGEEPELQVVDDESQLDAPETFVLDEGEGKWQGAAAGTGGDGTETDAGETGNTYLADEPLPAESYPVEEGWEPVSATPGSVAADGAELQEADAQAEAEAEPDESELVGAGVGDGSDGLYADAMPPQVVGVARRRSRMFAILPALAAAVFVIGSGAVVVLRPEWFGLHFEPQLVDRTQIARPTIEVVVPTPAMPVAGQRVTTPVQPTPPPVQPTPGHDLDPRPIDPQTTPVPTIPDPVHPQPVPTVPEPTADDRLLPVGQEMLIGGFHKAAGADSWLSIPVGSKAFTQLYNGNFFIGSVRAVAADALVLKVGTGEVTLLRKEIEKVTGLDSEEYAELQRATTGFVRLSNNNRLVGTILRTLDDDNVVLQMRSDRIVVPRRAVETIVEHGGDQLKFNRTEDEEQWLREIAVRHLRAMSSGQPAPVTGSKAALLVPDPMPNKPAPKAAPPKAAPAPKAAAPKPAPAKSSGATRPVPKKAAAKPAGG